MTTNPAAGIGCIQIGGITVDVEDHVGGSKTNGGIRMSGTVVKKLSNGEVCAYGGSGLFMGNGA